MQDPPDDGRNEPESESGNGLKIRKKWQELDKLPTGFGWRDDLPPETEPFYREVYHIKNGEVCFFSQPNVRETLAVINSLAKESERTYFARTVGQLADEVDRHQATVVQAIQELQKLPIIMRLPLPVAQYGDVITGIPSTLAFGKEALHQLNQNGREITPQKGSRAEAILLAYARDCHEEGAFLSNNIEALIHGEIIDLNPQNKISIGVNKNGEHPGLLEVVARGDQVPHEVWETVEDRVSAVVSGLATVMTYNPETKTCKPVEKAERFVWEQTPDSPSGEQRHNWVVDFVNCDL